MTRVPDDKFDTESTEIAQDIENTLDRVVNDYSEHWKGVIGEWIQNAYDGWCHNRFGRQTISKTQDLTIRFEVDLNKRLIKMSDDAGGMPEETFHHNFAGLDTPGEEKQSGGFGGSYGRGSHVISGAGEEMYAETRHTDFQGGLVVRGARQMVTDAQIGLDNQGTYVEVHDVDPEVITPLTDWEAVRRYIQSRFNPLLQHDNVTVEYSIEGDTHVVKPLDFSEFDVLFEGDIEFEYHGDTFTLEDVRIFDRTSADTDIPINGVAMLKSNQHMDKPFMRVQDYRPRQLRHMDKMFGVCDASALCPEYEDNAHNSFTGNIVSETGVKRLLEDLERKHFIGTPTDLNEKEDIVSTTLEIVNKQWDHNPFGDGNSNSEGDVADDSGDDTTATATTATQPDAGDDEDAIDEQLPTENDNDENGEDGVDDETDDAIDELDIDWLSDTDASEESDDDQQEDDDADDTGEDEEDEFPELTCSTRSRSFATDDTVDVWVFIENPDTYTAEDFTITAQLEHDETGDIITLDEKDLTVPPGHGSSGDDKWEYHPEETGKYLFRASLYEDGDTAHEEIDTTHTWFWVGRDTAESEQNVETVSFLEDVMLVRSDDEDFRAELNEGNHGVILVANTRHPEYKHAVKLDGRTGTRNQKLTLIRWAHDSIMTRLLLDHLDDQLADMYTDNGTPIAEELGGFVRDNLIEESASLMAGAYDEL